MSEYSMRAPMGSVLLRNGALARVTSTGGGFSTVHTSDRRRITISNSEVLRKVSERAWGDSE